MAVMAAVASLVSWCESVLWNPQMWCDRTESADAALDLFLRIFGRTPASFPIFRGICTNRRCCITDRPSIFSSIGTFTFTFLSRHFLLTFELLVASCSIFRLLHQSCLLLALHNLAQATTTCQTTKQPQSAGCHQGEEYSLKRQEDSPSKWADPNLQLHFLHTTIWDAPRSDLLWGLGIWSSSRMRHWFHCTVWVALKKGEPPSLVLLE